MKDAGPTNTESHTDRPADKGGELNDRLELDEAAGKMASPISKGSYQVVQTQEFHRTTRVALCGGYILVGFIVFVTGVVIVLIHNTNPYLKALELLAAILIVAVPPFIPVYKTWRKIKIYFESHDKRSHKLEVSVDQHRESSGIDVDGSSPYDP